MVVVEPYTPSLFILWHEPQKEKRFVRILGRSTREGFGILGPVLLHVCKLLPTFFSVITVTKVMCMKSVWNYIGREPPKTLSRLFTTPTKWRRKTQIWQRKTVASTISNDNWPIRTSVLLLPTDAILLSQQIPSGVDPANKFCRVSLWYQTQHYKFSLTRWWSLDITF